jgi:putative membrane protein
MSADGLSWPGVYLRGFCMGAADAVPGVSGGTIALITGIYDRLIAAVTAVSPARVRDVVLAPRAPGTARDALDAMDAPFLVVLVTGVVTAVVTLSGLLEAAIDGYPLPTFAFFFGLIAASAVVLYRDVDPATPRRAAAAIAGFLLAFVASGQAAAALDTSLVTTFLAGAVAVSAMILPGLSGSLLLLVLGQYEHMIGALNGLGAGALAALTGGDASLVDPAVTVTVFVAGALVGLFSVAHAVRRALERYREATLVFLVSLIVGALRAPAIRIGGAVVERGGWTPELAAVAAAAAVAGGVAILAVEGAANVGYE